MNLTYSRTYLLFLGILLANIFLTFALNYLLMSDNLIFNEYSSQLSYRRIKELIESGNKYKFITYLLIPLIYFFKFSTTTIFLAIGFFFVIDDFEFKRIFKIVVVSEVIFFIPVILKLVWFLFVKTNYSLNDLRSFSPFSLVNFFDYDKLDKWMIYPLRLANIFEVIYCCVLVVSLKNALKISLKKSISTVIISYGSAILFWIVFTTFLTLTIL